MKTRKLFVSYSHKDIRWADAKRVENLVPWLEQQLGREGVQIWYDHALKDLPGEPFKTKIQSEIEEADLAILLLSQNFASSDFIRDFELPLIRARVERGELIVLPILVGPIDWDYERHLHWITDRQMLPGWPMPLIEYAETPAKFEALRVQILQAIRRRIADKWPPPEKESDRGPPPPPPPPRKPILAWQWLTGAALVLGVVLLVAAIIAPARNNKTGVTAEPPGGARNNPAGRPAPDENDGRIVLRPVRDFSVRPRGFYGVLSAAFYRGDAAIIVGGSLRVFVLDIQSGKEMRGFDIPEAACLAFTRDGNRALSARGTIHLWDTWTGTAINQIEAYVSALAFSPDERRVLANGSGDKSEENQMCIYGLDAERPTACTRLSEQERKRGNSVTAMAFLPDGKSALGASTDGFLYLWDLKSSGPSRRLQGHASYVSSVTVSQDGRYAASGDDQGNIFVWSLADGRETCHFQAHKGRVTSMVFAGRMNLAISGGQDKTIRAWEPDSCRELQRVAVDGFVLSLALSPDGSKLVSGGGYGLNLWQLQL
ncbi:MAG TPA: TIR domain-containing protein [Polyangia bacterium]|jgi:FOG: WD40 repeat|nr:TIR domain-containing protein [Polyangia bacterium]